jgi:hypothetical protein
MKFIKKIIIYSRSLEKKSFDQENLFLNNLDTPKCDFDRSFLQYKCHRYIEGIRLHMLFNLISFVPFLLLIFIAPFFAIFCKLFKSSNEIFDTVSLSQINRIMVPDKYNNFKKIPVTGYWLQFKDLYYFYKQLFTFIPNPYFGLRIFYQLTKTRSVIQKFKPKTILVSNEYSFWSSYISFVCENEGIFLVNIMHGEKIFNIRDSFFRFSCMFVWEEYYIDLFKLLRANVDSYVKFNPFVGKINSNVQANNKLCYYLQLQKIDDLSSINYEIKRRSKVDVFFRLHPIYSKELLLKGKKFKFDIIHDIFESLSTYQYICSSYSTVLFICLCNNRRVIFDDINIDNDLIKRYSTYHQYRKYIDLLTEMKPNRGTC